MPLIDFTKYGDIITGLGTKIWKDNYGLSPLAYNMEAKSLAFDSTFNSLPKTTKYYEKLTLVYCPFTPKDFNLHDYNDKKGVEKSKNKGNYNTVYSFKNDGSVSFKIVCKNVVDSRYSLISSVKKCKYKSKVYYYVQFEGKELKINNKTLLRLISTCVINKSKIETPIIFLKEKRSWVPYSIDDYTVKQAMKPEIKYSKSTIGDLIFDFKFDDKEYQRALELMNWKKP